MGIMELNLPMHSKEVSLIPIEMVEPECLRMHVKQKHPSLIKVIAPADIAGPNKEEQDKDLQKNDDSVYIVLTVSIPVAKCSVQTP
jgi:hypothetical protein